jgi:hypothetical protein
MNDDNTLDEDELRSRGFFGATRTLDDSEERGDAGHWLNTSGKRLYSLSRVIDAEQLRDSCSNGVYRHARADVFNASHRPRTPAIIVVDYRRILKRIAPEIAREIWSARLSHPVVGRRPGSRDREQKLVVEALIALMKYAGGPTTTSSQTLFDSLTERAGSAGARLGPPWPDVVLRRADLGYDIARAVSPRAAGRLLDIYALVHAGRISGPLTAGKTVSIVDLLIESPAMRFDHRILQASPEP